MRKFNLYKFIAILTAMVFVCLSVGYEKKIQAAPVAVFFPSVNFVSNSKVELKLTNSIIGGEAHNIKIEATFLASNGALIAVSNRYCGSIVGATASITETYSYVNYYSVSFKITADNNITTPTKTFKNPYFNSKAPEFPIRIS